VETWVRVAGELRGGAGGLERVSKGQGEEERRTIVIIIIIRKFGV